MFLRVRWFTLGALSAIGGGAYVLARLRRIRARLTFDNLRRATEHAIADGLGHAGRVIAPDGEE